MTTISSDYPIPLRELGKTGVKLPAIGFGAMGLSGMYGAAGLDDAQSQAMLREAVKLGCTFWDTADVYGAGLNESLLAPLLAESRDKIFICTKFGAVYAPGATKFVRGDRAYVLEQCELSLKRLGLDHIDLYYQHRVDPETPIEETVAAMKELQDVGKVKHLGLSECSKETLERALKVARIDALEIEYSPWEIGPERSGLLDIMRKHSISLVAYSPLGRGMLTGSVKSTNDLADDDFRKTDPRFQGVAFKLNLRLVERIAQLAAEKSKTVGFPVTPAEFCLAWVLYQGEDFFVIPGTKSLNRLKENLTAGKVLQTFTKEDDEAVRKLIQEINVVGDRYADFMMKGLDL